MNLGVEDAWVFSELAKRDQLSSYHKVRWPVDHAIVQRIKTFTGFAKGESWWKRMARNHLAPHLLRLNRVRQTMLHTVSGLDHPLPTWED